MTCFMYGSYKDESWVSQRSPVPSVLNPWNPDFEIGQTENSLFWLSDILFEDITLFQLKNITFRFYLVPICLALQY